MRAIFIIALLLSALPANASDRYCRVMPATQDGAYYYAAHVSHEELEQDRTLIYTASPPVTLYAQHYITDTYVITISDTPPITRTIWTFEFSETTDIVGYAPFASRPHDYAYMFRSFAPFHAWACTTGAQAHTFLPIVSR